MAYSPFDELSASNSSSSFPELSGLDSINLEEELKKISENMTTLERTEGAAKAQVAAAAEGSQSELIDVVGDGEEPAQPRKRRRIIGGASAGPKVEEEKKEQKESSVSSLHEVLPPQTASPAAEHAAAEQDEEPSWSWGEPELAEAVEDTGDGGVAERQQSGLLAEDLDEDEAYLAREWTAGLNEENPFERAVMMRQRRVAKLWQRIEAHKKQASSLVDT